MTSITPISATRTSDLQVRQRLLTQLQGDQAELLRLQTSISTGRVFELPSQAPPAALRALSLQKLLEEKDQIKKNLQTSQSYLATTDSAAGSVSGLLADARSIALQGADGTTTATLRQALGQQIDKIVQQIVSSGNQQFRGRYLFSGGNTQTLPYQLVNNVVRYDGNETHIRSFSDIGVLFDTNVPGHELFGGLATDVQGTIDLNPRATAATRLRDLRGGQGILPGSILISDGTNSTTVDISQAETLGDVAGLIESHAPAGRQLRVTITGAGLNVQLLPTVPATPGNLTIKEVGIGTTAHELGVFNGVGVGVGTIVGQDLNPRLTPTTLLDNAFGVRASARVFFNGQDNDLLIEARQRGAAYNDVTITFVDGGPAAAGNETAVYDGSNPLNKTLVVTIAEGISSAQDAIDAINATTTFRASLDPADANNSGLGKIQSTVTNPQATGVSAGGSGLEPDLAAGLQIVSNGQQFTVDLSSAATVEDLLNVLNGSGAEMLAEINASATGVNLRSRLSGADFTVGENGGLTATHLGLRTLVGSTRLEELNHGQGVDSRPTGDFQIRRKDGAIISITLTGAVTIDDVLTQINSAGSNPNDAWHVTARLARQGNGIELASTSAVGVATLAVLTQGSPAANQLGLMPADQSVSSPAVVNGAEETITGADIHPREGHGVLNALIRLRNALNSSDLPGIERAAALLDQGTDQFNLSRASLGSQQQTIDAWQNRLAVEQIDLKGALSQEIDVDLAQAISDFAARQAAFEASLQLIGRTSKLTLLDFI